MDTVTLQFASKVESAGLSDDMCLIIDETGNPKKGRRSAGVKRQYCGQVGKIENSQVGVFGALCAGSLVNLVQASLSGVSEKVTKIHQAGDIIKHVIKELRVPVRWVCFDAFYGRNAALLADLIANRIEFIADVQDNLQIWLEPFQIRVPAQDPERRGPKFKNARPNRQAVSIKDYAASLSARDWKFLAVRHQSTGKKLQAWFHSKEVYILNPKTKRREKLTLLIRQDKDGTIKYSLCYCPQASLKELAYRQSKRYFVEKAFRDGKKELGLNEYQTRSEESWHRHMGMVMLAQLFLNEEKLFFFEQEQLSLSLQDIVRSLKSVLQFLNRSIESLLNNILSKQPPDKRLLKKSLYLQI
jgi:SRSO17 transposase